jgi:hypothetical protein
LAAPYQANFKSTLNAHCLLRLVFGEIVIRGVLASCRKKLPVDVAEVNVNADLAADFSSFFNYLGTLVGLQKFGSLNLLYKVVCNALCELEYMYGFVAPLPTTLKIGCLKLIGRGLSRLNVLVGGRFN